MWEVGEGNTILESWCSSVTPDSKAGERQPRCLGIAGCTGQSLPTAPFSSGRSPLSSDALTNGPSRTSPTQTLIFSVFQLLFQRINYFPLSFPDPQPQLLTDRELSSFAPPPALSSTAGTSGHPMLNK